VRRPGERHHLPFTLPAGATPPTAVKLYNAAAGTGEGIFTLTASINVAIPANAYAGVYASTVSLSIAAGP
jgi:hypothetical protein